MEKKVSLSPLTKSAEHFIRLSMRAYSRVPILNLAIRSSAKIQGKINVASTAFVGSSNVFHIPKRMNSTEAAGKGVAEIARTSLHPLYEHVPGDAVLTNSPSDLVIQAIEATHLGMQIPYWETIVILTIGMRVLLLPVGIKTAQSSARMAAVRPLLTKVTEAMKRDPHANTMARKQQYSEQSKALLLQYKVNPFISLAMPIMQLPIFMSCFFALQKIGDYLPAVKEGGILWFTDLAAADSTMILPIANALSFLLMIEIGADGMATTDQDKFRWVMRGLAFIMTPLTMTMSQGLFVYWTTNNAISVTQTMILKQPAIRKYFDMPEPPKESKSSVVSGNTLLSAVESIKKEFSKDSSLPEIVDGSGKAATKNMPLVKPDGPAPKTFAHKPKNTTK